MKSYQQTQHAFIAHIKDPKANPNVDGVDDRRLKIYRDLFFNNVLGFLSSGFPVLESLFSEASWRELARKFFAEHQCSSPYFIDISKEFVEYLSSEYELTHTDPVFMQELAHYEWLELDLSVRKPTQEILPWDGVSEVGAVQLSELASLVSYQYPVHQISRDYQPSESSDPIYIVVYRNDDDEVNFTLVNAVTAHLLMTVQDSENLDVESLVDIMGEALPQLPREQLNDSLRQAVLQLLTQQILLPH